MFEKDMEQARDHSPDVTAEVARLGVAREELVVVVGELMRRLGPLVRHSYMGDGESATDIELCPLAEDIRTERYYIEGVIERLQKTLTELELP